MLALLSTVFLYTVAQELAVVMFLNSCSSSLDLVSLNFLFLAG